MTDDKHEQEQELETTSPPTEEQQEVTEETAPVAEFEPTLEATPLETPASQEETPVQEQEAPAEPPAEEPKAEAEPAQPEAPVEKKPVEEKPSDEHYSDSFKGLSKGDLVEGVVVHIDQEGVLVDVGMKSEGIIRPGELSIQRVDSPEDVVAVGDKIKVYVMQSEDGDGNLILSKKRADFEKAWERVQAAFDEGKVVTAMVTDRVKGGLQVDLGVRGFVPGSHVGSGKIMNLDRFVGQSLPLRIIEVDRERRKVVLSHRLAIEEQRSKQRESTVAALTEGAVRPGVVRRITDYGAFVDLGGVDGLLHVSEMSWTRVSHPSAVVKVGQKINVMILKLDLKNERISLGLRQILPDPWAEVEGKYRVGDIVQGRVTRLVPFGAFVQLEEGIEAIIPNTELSYRKIKRPDDVVSVGQEVEVKVIDVRPDERRMTLSLRQLQEREPVQPKPQPAGYQSSGFSGSMTLGDLIGDKLADFVAAAEEEAPKAEEAEPAEEAPKPKAKKPRTTKKAKAETAEEAQAPAPVEPEVQEAAPEGSATEAEQAAPDAEAAAEQSEETS